MEEDAVQCAVLESEVTSISLVDPWMKDHILMQALPQSLMKTDNSAIYIQELNDNVTLDDLAEFFKKCGATHDPYLPGQRTGKLKGDATVSYEDPLTAMGCMGGHGGDKRRLPSKQTWDSRRNLSGEGNGQHQAGNWECPSPGCGNHNFTWRTECNQNKAPKPVGFFSPFFPIPDDDHGRNGLFYFLTL